MKHTDFMAIAKDQWDKNLSEEDKQPYIEAANRDTERYANQLEQWKKEGFYLVPKSKKN